MNDERDPATLKKTPANHTDQEVGVVNDGFEMADLEAGKPPDQSECPEHDPWSADVTEIRKDKPWSELSTGGKAKRVLWNYISKPVLLIGALYLFICSLDFLSSAFRLLGGKAAGKAFADNEHLQNPFAGLMVGVLATVLVQSSSTTTSIVISMVAGKVMYVKTAIPIVMGANIGTSVTNTIVSMGHVSEVDEFRRAFGAATVHDMFNLLTVLIFLPLEIITGYLERLTSVIVDSMPLERFESGKQDLLKTITKPLTALVIKVDTKKITSIAIAHGDTGAVGDSLIKIWCKSKTVFTTENVTVSNTTAGMFGNLTVNDTVEQTVATKVGVEKCTFMFMNVAGVWSDEAIGAILLVMSLAILCACLVMVVKILNSILKGGIASALKKFVNADLPGKLSWLTGYLAIIIGAGLTILVQSSSVFTSTLTPLVGVGVLTLDRMYPLTLGSNIGTTATGILASLAATGETLDDSIQVAFCHLFFNISGIIFWYPIPILRRVPIKLAMFLGNETAKYRWFALFYLFLMFFVIPGTVFGLSLAGWYVLLAIAAPIIIIIVAVAIINVLQNKRPTCLPKFLQDWLWLPLCLRSLEPMDSCFQTVCFCCKKFSQDVHARSQKVEPEVPEVIAVSREVSRASASNGGVKSSVSSGAVNQGFVADDEAKFGREE